MFLTTEPQVNFTILVPAAENLNPNCVFPSESIMTGDAGSIEVNVVPVVIAWVNVANGTNFPVPSLIIIFTTAYPDEGATIVSPSATYISAGVTPVMAVEEVILPLVSVIVHTPSATVYVFCIFPEESLTVTVLPSVPFPPLLQVTVVPPTGFPAASFIYANTLTCFPVHIVVAVILPYLNTAVLIETGILLVKFILPPSPYLPLLSIVFIFIDSALLYLSFGIVFVPAPKTAEITDNVPNAVLPSNPVGVEIRSTVLLALATKFSYLSIALIVNVKSVFINDVVTELSTL